MTRDIEDTLTTRLTLLFNERYGLPESGHCSRSPFISQIGLFRRANSVNEFT